MKHRVIFAMSAVSLVLAFIVAGALNLWASTPERVAYVENVCALDGDYFFFTCYGSEEPDGCTFTCIRCGHVYASGDGTFGRVVGKCPICQIEYPDTVDYNSRGNLIW